jgi:hypothetical protein
MMNAPQCQAKAQAALAKAVMSTDRRIQAAYADCAAHWIALQKVAAVHERLQFDLIGRPAHQG